MKTMLLGDIARIKQGYTFKPKYQGQQGKKWPYIKVADVGSPKNTKYLKVYLNSIDDQVFKEINVQPFESGSIVFPRVGAALRNNNKRLLVRDCLTDDNVIVITVKNTDQCYNEFLYYWFVLKDLAKFCNDGLVPVINAQNLKIQKINLPPLSEQKAIAELLAVWDEAIEKTERLIQVKEKRLDAYGREVFDCNRSGKVSGWLSVRLKDVLLEHGDKSTGNEEVYSVSVHKGLVNQIEHLGRSFSAANTDNYNCVHYGDIVYTKSPTGDFPLGIVKQSYSTKNVIVSPLYGVFSPKSFHLGVVINFYFSSPERTKNYLFPIVQKGAKNTIAITNKTFLSSKLHLPVDEASQKMIAEYVSAARDEIDMLKQLLKKYKTQKRGLMQKMFTGEWQMKPEIINQYMEV